MNHDIINHERSPKMKKTVDKNINPMSNNFGNFKPNKAIEQRPRSTGFKSFLNWFKKVENLQREEYNESSDSDFDTSDEDSSSSSTATVASFAFLPANKYKPYGDADQPEKFFSPGPYTNTYLRLILERNRRRSLDKNITLRKKYSLYTSGTLPTQIDNLNNNEPKQENTAIAAPNSLYDTFSLPTLNKMKVNELCEYKDDRKTASLSTKTGSHVKGKRKAPQPPVSSDFMKSYRKKRKAPPPPTSNDIKDATKKDDKKTPKEKQVENVVHKEKNKNASSPSHAEITPKPWYKRESKQKTSKNNTPESTKKKSKHEFPEVSFFRCSQLFENIRNSNSDKSNIDVETNKSENRVSRFLPNISELDREAAEIIKQHKSIMKNEEIESTQWANRPSSARDLISKFNALSVSAEQNKKPFFGSPKLNRANNEIKLTTELIIKKQIVENNQEKFSPILGSPKMNAKNPNANFSVGLREENKDKNKKTSDFGKIPKEGEISNSFKTEIFSALPELKCSNENVKNSKMNQSSGEKLSYLEEKIKLKEMLKEMKDSLPKRPKPTNKKDPQIENVISDINGDPSANISESTVAPKNDIINVNKITMECVKSQIITSDKQNNAKNLIQSDLDKGQGIDEQKPITETQKKLKKSINNDPIYSNKVSSFAQTNCILQKSEHPLGNEQKISAQKANEKIDDKNLEQSYVNSKNVKQYEKKPRPASCLVDFKNVEPQTNTNILLKKLEQAISEGDDTTAAQIAKDLAMQKVNCMVTYTPNKIQQVDHKRVQVYIEDQFSHQGPLYLQILENSTIGELKKKVEGELNIPILAQRWIIGKQLAADDSEFLTYYNNKNFEIPLFLYVTTLASKNISKAEEISKDRTQNESNTKRCLNISSSEGENINKTKDESKVTTNVENKNELKEYIPETTKSDEPLKSYLKLPNLLNSSSHELKNITKNTWTCSECTLINSLLSPICSACGKKPEVQETKENPKKSDQNINHYKELLNLDNQELVFNPDSFECPICFINCETKTGIMLRECLHSFCRECLENTIKYSDEVELKCPYRDKDYSCDSIIPEREIRALVDKTLYESRLAKSVQLAENKTQNAFHCKTPDCKGWCIFDDNVNEFNCPACRKINCLMCQVIHEGKNCKQYQEQIQDSPNTSKNEGQQTKNMLDEMVKKGEAMSCPSCQVIMMKKWGCDWVRCSMCKTEICWVTRGPRWGPSGKGDISAGCQCGVNGVKCHPKCNYCH